MKILHTLPRHNEQLLKMQQFVGVMEKSHQGKYICVVIDTPETINRQASYASSFDNEDTHKIFQALAEQTKQ